MRRIGTHCTGFLMTTCVTQSYEPILLFEEDGDLEVTSYVSDRNLQVKMVQCTGSFLDAFTRDELLQIRRKIGDESCQFWKPGRLGHVVEDPLHHPIGSVHIHHELLGITVSSIVFSNGKFKLSLGRGLECRHCSVEEVNELADSIMFRMTGRRMHTFHVHLISAVKLYDPIESVCALGNVLEKSGEYARIRRPHFTESGRICAVRAYGSAEGRAHVAIDHGGWSHFTGFNTIDGLRESEQTFDRCMDMYRRTVLETPIHTIGGKKI